MKRFFFTLSLLLLFGWQAEAQQEPLFAQYNNNSYLINPAVAGSKGIHSLQLFHRWQWVAFPGAPKLLASIIRDSLANRMALGAYFL